MSAKQPGLSGLDIQGGQDALPELTESKSQSVPIPEFPANYTAPNHSDPTGLEPMLGNHLNPPSEATEKSESQYRLSGSGEAYAFPQPAGIHQDGQDIRQHGIGIAGVSDGYLQNQTTWEPIDPFMSNSTDASPRRTIELQSNNPFKARLEQSNNDGTSNASSPTPFSAQQRMWWSIFLFELLWHDGSYCRS